MAFLPTGTITFLFTDIEGSTKLWDAHSTLMRPALERHDALLRAAIVGAGGVVFKTVGDAFCAAFASAPNALEAATQAQSALLGEPWPEQTPLRVRMALHTGIAQERDGDYFGPVLNRVARLLSAGHGGQTLVSAPTYELMRDHLSAGVELQDLGSHRLKDLERPEHIYQASAPGLPGVFAPLKTLDNTPNNLPQQVTSFIGREKSIADVTALLDKTRLLTLTAAGGSGKTRLSLQVAADTLDLYADGTWLIELAPLTDPALVPQAVASALGVTEQSGQSLTQTLTSALKDKTLLLVLDNCEHLISACAQLTAVLLRSCPKVKLLTTSREPLGIGGETTYRVPPLTLPDTKSAKATTPESVSQFEAVRLFIDRAQAVKPDFAVTATNAPALAQLCYRLDGIPLAIELAAARVRSLAVEQINDKLDSRFRILTGGDKSALPRQQTLRALVDWSYDLLTEAEKTLFARLSVFADGWTLQAAESVSGWEPIEDWEVLDLLTSLADKSLIIADEQGDETRYRMLQTLKQYGAEKLTEINETDSVKAHCRDYFVQWVEKDVLPNLSGPEQPAWMNRWEAEHDNLRAVMDECAATFDTKNAEAVLRLAGSLWRLWYVRGFFTEGQERGMRALECANGLEETPQIQRFRATAKTTVANLANSQGHYVAARTRMEEVLALYRVLGDRVGIAASLFSLGHMFLGQGRFVEARAFYEESLALYRELNDQKGAVRALASVGSVASAQGDFVTARTLLEESLAIYRTLGDKWGAAVSMSNMAEMLYRQGDLAGAQPLFNESLAIYRALGERQNIALSIFSLSSIAFARGDFATAWSLCEESQALLRDIGDRHGVAECLERFASCCLEKNAAEKAVTLFAATTALRKNLELSLSVVEQEAQNAEIAKARTLLDAPTFSAAWEQGRAMDWEQAADFAVEQNSA